MLTTAGSIASNLYRNYYISAVIHSVECNGTEDSIFDCQFISSTCRSNRDASVICQGLWSVLPICAHPRLMFPYKWTANHDVAVANCTNGEVRLVDGPSTNKGRLEVCHNQAWTTVCNNGFGTEESRVICGQLGFQRYGI